MNKKTSVIIITVAIAILLGVFFWMRFAKPQHLSDAEKKAILDSSYLGATSTDVEKEATLYRSTSTGATLSDEEKLKILKQSTF